MRNSLHYKQRQRRNSLKTVAASDVAGNGGSRDMHLNRCGQDGTNSKSTQNFLIKKINEIIPTRGHKLSKPFKNVSEAHAIEDPASEELSLHPLKRERFPSACLRHSLLISKALGADPIRNA